MKAIVTFEFSQDDDGDVYAEIARFERLRNLSIVAHEFASYLRGRLKHEEMTEEKSKAVQECSDEFWRLMSEYGVDPYE